MSNSNAYYAEQQKQIEEINSTCPPRGPFGRPDARHRGKHVFQNGRTWCICGAKRADRVRGEES